MNVNSKKNNTIKQAIYAGWNLNDCFRNFFYILVVEDLFLKINYWNHDDLNNLYICGSKGSYHSLLLKFFYSSGADKVNVWNLDRMVLTL